MLSGELRSLLLVTELASVLRRALESILLAIIIDEVPAAAAADDTPVDESDVVGMDFIFVDVVATAAVVVV